MQMHKRPILLLELMIALVLLGAISAFLFTTYRDLSLAKTVLKKERKEIFDRLKLQLRLCQVLSQLKTVEQKSPHSYLFTYDHGSDPDPHFVGLVDGHLHLSGQRLVLISTSKQGVTRQEILSENINTFELKFFNRQKGIWQTQYPPEKPLMIQLVLNHSLTIPFFL